MIAKIASTYRWTDLPWLAGTAALYALLAKLVLTFYSANGLVTIFWPSAGVSLAALLLGGRKFWPAVYVGALAGNAWAGESPAAAALIAVGSTIEPLLGAWLLTRKGDFSVSLASFRDFFRLAYLAGLFSPGVCALAGVGVLLLFGDIGAADYGRNAALWWMGDTLGIVVVTPFILAWRHPPALPRAPLGELVAVFGLSFLVGQIIFLDWFHDAFGQINRGYWMYLIVSWAAVRFGLHGVILVVLTGTLQALVGAAEGVGFFANDLAMTQLTNFWAYTMILAVVGTSLATMFAERERAAGELRKLSLAVEQSPASIVITDAEGRIEYVNPAFCQVSGYAAAEVLGRNPRLLQSGRTPAAAYARLWHSLRQGKTWRGEFVNRRKDGSEYVEQAIISPVRRPDGQVDHYLAVKEDVTERMEAAARLQASEERLRLAQEAAGIGIFDYDMVGGGIRLDRRMRELWGLPAGEPDSHEAVVAGVHPEDRAARAAAFAAAIDPAGDGKYRAEFRVVGRADGRQRTVASTGQTFFEDGRAVRFIGAVQDITERKALEKAFQERRSEMEALLQQQVAAQTAAAIAHELNQPLVAISAYAEVAQRLLRSGAPDAAKLLRAVDGSAQQAQRAGGTLHELLDFLHRGEAETAPLDINGLIREAIAIAHEDGYGGFRAELELEPGLPPVLGNRLQVQKVLINLLRNGVEAMREAGAAAAAITIAVRTAAGSRMAQVTVKDSGPGLDAEMARRVFEPFFTTKPHGIGLGLAISRALVEAHGGQLWVDPEVGPGATFHFTLPFAHE